jgi:hypothetical protein
METTHRLTATRIFVLASVINPTKVTRTALQNATSIAGLLLATEAVVVEKQEDKAAAAGGSPGGGMGGMYYMTARGSMATRHSSPNVPTIH